MDDFSTRTVRTCEWSPCGRYLAAASFDGNTTVWRVGGSALAAGAHAGVVARGCVAAHELALEVLAALDGHENEVKGVSWSASGELLATCGRDKSVWLWEAVDEGSDFECIAVLHGHEQDVKGLAWHPRRDVLATVSYDDSIRLWGEGGEDWVAVQVLPSAHASTVWCAAWEAGGERLASVGDDGCLRLWGAKEAPGKGGVEEAMELHPLTSLSGAHARTAFSVSWAAPGTVKGGGDSDGAQQLPHALIATCGADDAVKVFSVEGRDGGGVELVERAHLPAAHAGDVNAVRWHNSQPLLASAGDDCAVRVWKWQVGGQ